MIVELGNPAAKNVGHSDPCVTRVVSHKDFSALSVVDLKDHLRDAILLNESGVTNFPGAEALLDIVHPLQGLWREHASQPPSWVASDNPDLEAALAEYFGCPRGVPADVEDTHWTVAGPPGVSMSPGPLALLVNSGLDILAQLVGGATVGTSGTATSTSATTLANTGASWGTNSYAKCCVITPTAFGIVESNTGTVLTIDRWYNFATPGGAAASTPGGTSTYVVMPGTFAAWFMGLTANSGAAAGGDTTLTGEITTAGGGLIRAICTYAHTASATTFTLSNTFTANGSDTLPVTIAKVATFISMVVGWSGSMFTETLLNATATLNLVGDQLTVTETETM